MSATETLRNIYHDGELAVQERAGAMAQARSNGRVIRDAIIPGAIKLAAKQPFLVVGSVDSQQRLWASIVVGRLGFIAAAPDSLDIDLSQVLTVDADPLWRNLAGDPRVGVLIIDLRSRARLRVNGRIDIASENQLHVAVEQAYPNCPQYIQRRNYRPANEKQLKPVSATGIKLSDHQHRWLATADTLFVSSGHPSSGMDLSHRGGNPGFIQVLSETRLRIPDYSGNGMFNTLGNFAVNPHAGIVIPDFDNGRTLQLTGRAQVLWDVDDPRNETGGTGRYWEFEINRWIESENSLPGSTEFLDYSSHNPVCDEH